MASLSIVYIVLHLGYIVLSVVQFFAIYNGISLVWGVPWYINIFLSSPIAVFPVIGTATGIWGAYAGWGLSLFVACSIFVLPWILLFLILYLSTKCNKENSELVEIKRKEREEAEEWLRQVHEEERQALATTGVYHWGEKGKLYAEMKRKAGWI